MAPESKRGRARKGAQRPSVGPQGRGEAVGLTADAREFPKERFIEDARAILGVPSHVAAGALYGSAPGELMTVDEAIADVEAFLGHRVFSASVPVAVDERTPPTPGQVLVSGGPGQPASWADNAGASGVRGKNLPAPGAAEDGKGFYYDHASGAFVWGSAPGGPIVRRQSTATASALTGGVYNPDPTVPIQFLTLDANATLGDATSAPPLGTQITLFITQDSTGGRTVSFQGTQWSQILPRVSGAPWGPTVLPLLWTAAGWVNMTGAGAGQRYVIGTAGRVYAFNSGWSNDGTVGAGTGIFFADAMNVVHFSGAIKRTAGAGAVAFTLPLGYYPKNHTIFVPIMQSGGAAGGFMSVAVDGQVSFTPSTVATTFYLDGASFPAGV